MRTFTRWLEQVVGEETARKHVEYQRQRRREERRELKERERRARVPRSSDNRARDAFEALRPHGWHDAEVGYLKDPSLARDAAKGQTSRAICALQLETELRTNPSARADRFVERWQTLERKSSEQYRAGHYAG